MKSTSPISGKDKHYALRGRRFIPGHPTTETYKSCLNKCLEALAEERKTMVYACSIRPQYQTTSLSALGYIDKETRLLSVCRTDESACRAIKPFEVSR